jgi:hypothetical protein
MDSIPRNLSLLAATAIVVAVLSGSAPALAADATAVATSAATTDVSAKASSKHSRRHSPTRLSHYSHPVRSAENYLGCSGAWCGRQFVLMVGIGF